MPAPSGFDHVSTTKSNSTRAIAARPRKKRKDGAQVLARVVLGENHTKPRCAEHHLSAAVVDGRSAPVAVYSAVARGAKRSLVAVPKFFRIGLVLRVLNASAMTGNLV
jgi:hypothetical protein